MPIRLPSLRGVIKWPRTATVVLATSGLVIVLVAVSRRIWRGGGKKVKDPDGTGSIKKSREKTDQEKKRSDSKGSRTTLKGKELLEEKLEPLEPTILTKEAKVNVAIENKSDVLTEKLNLFAKVAEETKETLTTKIRPSVVTESLQSQPKLAWETKTEVTIHNKTISLEEKPEAQATVTREIITKAVTQKKPDILTLNKELQLKAAKTEVTTQMKPIVLEEKPQAQHIVTATVETEVTTKTKPSDKEKSHRNKVQETDIKVSPLNSKVENKVENSNHPLTNAVGDHTAKKEVDKNAKPQIIFVEKNWTSFLPAVVTSTTESVTQEGTSQSVGKRDNYYLNGSAESRKEVVELCNKTEVIPQLQELVPKLTSDPKQIAGDTAVISDSKTLGRPLETESKPSNHLVGFEKKLESTSVSSPRVEQLTESVKVEDSQLEKVQEAQLKSSDNCGGPAKQLTSISPSTAKEIVKRVNSVISDSGEPLEVQVKSLDSLDNANKELKNSSASLETVEPVKVVKPVNIGLVKLSGVQLCESNFIDDTVNQLKDSCSLSLRTDQKREIVNSVISGVEKLQINLLDSSNNVEGEDKHSRDAVTSKKLVNSVISLESQSGGLQHIPFSSSDQLEDTDKYLKDISVSPSRTEKSEVVFSEEEKGVESEQVTTTSVFPEDSGETACEERVLVKEKEISDIETREERKACIRNISSEVALVAVVGTTEPATVEEKITDLCTEESGSSALGDQVGVVAVQPSCTTGAGLTGEEVEVCPVVKDLSKENRENNSIKSDSKLPSKGGEEGLKDKEIPSSPLEKGDMLTKGAEAKSDSVKGKNCGGKHKGKKGKMMLDEEVEKMVEKMEVKDIMRESEECILQNSDVAEDHSGKSSQVHASGISSPSIPNFPDNRSEGSSCGDSGKGRSDVTTPGGLEEDLREVSFSHHFSPPCSTSGPEEEEEEEDRVRRDSGSTAEDGSRGEIGSAIGGEEIIGEAAVVVGSDGLVIPVPVPIYHGMVPITPPPSVYEFVIPQGLVGRLIGKHGSFVNLIKARTSATIFIKTHPETNKLKVCAIEGTDEEIQAALDMIREKFPLRRYSSMTLEQVFFLPLPPPTFTLIPDSLPLQLVEGVSNDVILSALVSPSHYFLQQPTHPTYPTLAKLDMWMAMSYQDANAPVLPEDVKAGIICAAPTMGGWYRAQIVAVEELPSTPEDGSAEEGELIKWCDVRFVDYGGYERMPSNSLRQIRSDFMTLPFQASECYLASVIPAPTSNENEVADGWSMEAYALVEELTQAQVLKAQVVGHATDGLPLVLLYAFSHSYGQVVQVNNELVNRGLAVWAVPMVETDQVLLASSSETISGDENPPEEQAETAVA